MLAVEESLVTKMTTDVTTALVDFHVLLELRTCDIRLLTSLEIALESRLLVMKLLMYSQAYFRHKKFSASVYSKIFVKSPM